MFLDRGHTLAGSGEVEVMGTWMEGIRGAVSIKAWLKRIRKDGGWEEGEQPQHTWTEKGGEGLVWVVSQRGYWKSSCTTTSSPRPGPADLICYS